jgi:hypothetical protein
MRMRHCTVLVLCLFVLCLITACQPAESISIDDVAGVWEQDTGEAFMFLNEDGTYEFSGSISPDGPENLFEFGSYEHKGSTLTVHADDRSPGNCPGTTASVKVEFIEEDKIRFTLIEDECSAGFSSIEIWIRISP